MYQKLEKEFILWTNF